MKLAICGPGMAGKDTVCRWLRENTTLAYDRSTSEAATEIVFRELAPLRGYKTLAECFGDRRNNRDFWAETIWRFNGDDGTRLYRDMIATTDILNGIRRAAELRACVAAGIVDATIFVDRPGCIDSSCEFKADVCDIAILNHGSLDDLHAKLRRLAKILGILKGCDDDGSCCE